MVYRSIDDGVMVREMVGISQSARVRHAPNLFARPELPLNKKGRICRKLRVMTSTGLRVRSSGPLMVYRRLLKPEMMWGGLW